MSFLAGIAVLLLSCVGNAELWVILMNRRHSLRYRHHRLRRIRHLHDAGLLLFPPFLFLFAGMGQNGLLNGGTISQLRPGLQGIIYFTLIGVVPFSFSVIRWHLQRTPKRLLKQSAVCHDALSIATTDTERQLVKGDVQPLLSRFPWNQIYQLEVNHKQIQIGHAENASSSVVNKQTIRIAHFSDIHLIGCPGKGYHDFVAEQLCQMKPDAFIFTGDLIDRAELLSWGIDSFSKMAAVAPGYFVLGNHDWHLDHRNIRQGLIDAGWTDLGERWVTAKFGQMAVLVAGTETPWIGQNPDVPVRAEETLRVLLSHSPDQRDFAAANDFNLMLCGHNHGGQVVLPFVGPVYSPSRFGVRYSAGLFEHGDLLMHVSRGVAAKDTLRWNCRPEVTLLELQFEG